ncbi:MAG: 4-hydroxy-tetrahydrodipicolinate reductase [Tissierella sp.]|nr:4-hydroxy-tetrahydrodipicolinate reductase [Tissierella sp.]
MKIIVNGSNGRMGKELLKLIEDGYKSAQLAAAVNRSSGEHGKNLGFTQLDEFTGEADCIIDFTNHEQTNSLVQYAVKRNLPLVIATTGQTEEEINIIRKAGKEIPIFFSANMSVGIAILVELSKMTAQLMGNADIEIIEKHHNRKVDAPSGTALMIADAIKEVRTDVTYVKGRNGYDKREKNEIGIHAIRMGNIFGEHEVIIGTDTQTISLKHEVYNRSLFAEGALAAAEFIVNKGPGIYSMQDMVHSK